MKKKTIFRVVTNSEAVRWHMGKSLNYLANDFSLIVIGDGVSLNKALFKDITWIDLKIKRKISPIYDLYALFYLTFLCLKYKPVIIHSIMPKAGLISAIASFCAFVPIRLHTFTGQIWDTKKGIKKTLLIYIDKFIALLNSNCLTDSVSQSNKLFFKGISKNNQPLSVLGHGSLIGVDLSRFDRKRISEKSKLTRESLNINEDDFVISYIARKTIDKGAIDMISIFAHCLGVNNKFKLLFIGPDESDGLLDDLKLSNPNLFINIIEFGIVDNHEEFLNISDVLCMPSHREGFGTVVIEAAALSVPCVGTKISGLVDSVVDGKTGLLFERNDFSECARQLLSLADDRGYLNKLGRNAHDRASHFFSTDYLYKSLYAFYMSEINNLK